MKNNYKSNTLLILVAVALTTLSACAKNKREIQAQNKTPTLNLELKAPDNIVVKGNFSKGSPTVIMSDDKIYRVSLYSNNFPIPLQKIHSWTAHIEYANGKPLENAKIYIHGGMPAHRHGFPVTPRVKKYLGNGNYLIKGIKFSMMGEWEMRLNIKEQTQRDRAVFRITP